MDWPVWHRLSNTEITELCEELDDTKSRLDKAMVRVQNTEPRRANEQ